MTLRLASSPAALVAVVVRASGLEPEPEPTFAEKKELANQKRRETRARTKARAELDGQATRERWASLPNPMRPS